MKTRYLLKISIVGCLLCFPLFSFAQWDSALDCPTKTTAETCSQSIFCERIESNTGQPSVCMEKMNNLKEVVVTPCKETQVWNPETRKCDCGRCMKRDDKKEKCISAGIKLNTEVPFVSWWDGCIEFSNSDQITAFPTLIGALMRILTSAMLVVGFLMILIAGVMMTTWGASPNNYKSGKDMIFKVWAALALLGLMGVILKLINPTFFT